MTKFLLLSAALIALSPAVAGAVPPGTLTITAPAVATKKHCQTEAVVTNMLQQRGYSGPAETWLKFEIWQAPNGYLLTVGRLDGYMCLMWKESGWMV